MSLWSRLASWLRRDRKPVLPQTAQSERRVAAQPTRSEGELAPVSTSPKLIFAPEMTLPPQQVIADEDARPIPPREIAAPSPRVRRPRAVPVEAEHAAAIPAGPQPVTFRLGIDFGTSTTQVAVGLPNQSPRLLQLEPATEFMPSYFAMDGDRPLVGTVARNFGVNEHSIKTQLGKNEPMERLPQMLPSQAAAYMLEEVVRRTIEQLRRQRLLPESVDILEVATNLGCTSEWDLDQRLRLRNIAHEAGLNVRLATMIEEPVAASYEIMLSGLVTDGRVLVIDMGGGTLDVAVVRISDAGSHFELFASGGYPRGGDRFTEVIVARLTEILEERGVTSLNDADQTVLWERAEASKLGLSSNPSVIVALGGIGSLVDDTCALDRDWFLDKTRELRVRVKADVTNVYRMARLILDRGGKLDPDPGTIYFDEPRRGHVRRLSEVGLADDGLEHLDHVVLVGGGTQMPMIADLFDGIFGSLVLTPETAAIDRTAIVALGLARKKPESMVSLRYPAWGIAAMFDNATSAEVPLYEPFASAFRVHGGRTSEYQYEFDVPTGVSQVALSFRPLHGSDGEQWPWIALPAGADKLRLELTLFGVLSLFAGDVDLADGRAVPWRPAEADALVDWLPPWQISDWWTTIPTWDPRNDK